MLRSVAFVYAGGLLYFVNTTSDTVVIGACQNGNPGCSLRGAIQTANSHSGADGIEIDLPMGSVINLTAALPDITESVSITGPGPSLVTVRRDTGGSYRIFNVAAGPVSISGLTISNGTAFEGGGINKTSGTLTVTNCVFLGNGAHNGGGINNSGGTLNVTNCTFTNNGADGSGGGIANNFFGTVNVINSTFSGNIGNNGDPNAIGGGAIGNGNLKSSAGGFLNVTSCTITGNIAFHGGGISTGAAFAGGALTVTNSTIVGNFSGLSSSGGGIAGDGTSSVNIKNTIVALSTGVRDVSGFFTSSGFNLIGKIDGSTGLTAATDQTGTVASPLDPKIDPSGLQDNGGPTQTIALLFGSPAIDKGTSNGLTGHLTTDQRGTGFARTLNYSLPNASGGDGTDVGALEFGGPLIPISVSRKVHGAMPFDIALSGTGVGIECRSGGASGNHQLVMNFPAPVSLTSSSVTTGSGSVSNHSVNGSDVAVNLTSVVNAQKIVVTLFGVSDGSNTGDVAIPMDVLLGDTTGNGAVNASDIGQTKSRSGQSVDVTNFRSDVTANNSINASDVSLVKSRSGTALP